MSKIKVQDLKPTESSLLNSKEIKQVIGGAELLTNTRYYYETTHLDTLEFYKSTLPD
jgi:hypothetical protein